MREKDRFICFSQITAEEGLKIKNDSCPNSAIYIPSTCLFCSLIFSFCSWEKEHFPTNPALLGSNSKSHFITLPFSQAYLGSYQHLLHIRTNCKMRKIYTLGSHSENWFVQEYTQEVGVGLKLDFEASFMYLPFHFRVWCSVFPLSTWILLLSTVT